MTLTSPMCPVAERAAARGGDEGAQRAGRVAVKLDLVWDPPWNPGMMSEAAKLELGMV